MILLFLSCLSDTPEKSTPHNIETHGVLELDQGQQHPPLPANNPAWEKDVGGFVADFHWYGEHSWADVRMRVAGHLSTVGRDIARWFAQQGSLKAASKQYRILSETLSHLDVDQKGPSGQINTLLIQGATRDALLLTGIDKGKFNNEPSERFAGLRQRYYQIALSPSPRDIKSARALQLDLEPHLTLRKDLDLDGFKNFKDRHQLRVRLFTAYIETLDPLSFDEPWGYWRAEEIQRQALALGLALSWLGGEDWTGRLNEFHSKPLPKTPPTHIQPYQYPSHLLHYLQGPTTGSVFSAEEFGRLPTGDSLIDVAGQPGPMAIGKLLKLGLDDSKHVAWLESQSNKMKNELLENPEHAVAVVRNATTTLNTHQYGSRYYNVKQFRNAGVRQLARSGHPKWANALLLDNFPLHHQDWACPNRKGILLAISGRLLAVAGDPQAKSILDDAWQAGVSFLKKVEKAAANPINGISGVPGSHTPHRPHKSHPPRAPSNGHPPKKGP